MVQGYTQQYRESKSRRASNLDPGRSEAGKPFSRIIFYNNEAFWCSYPRRVANVQWTIYLIRI